MNIIRTQQEGFTLVELVVTMAIVAIVITIGVPSYRDTIANQVSVTSANELVTTMNLARSHALKSGKHVTVCRSIDGSTCNVSTGDWSDGWIVFTNKRLSGANTRSVDEDILRVFEPLKSDVSLIGSNGLANFISFRPTGDTDIAGGWLLCDKRGADHAKSVVLFRSGRAQISKTQWDGTALNCEAGGI